MPRRRLLKALLVAILAPLFAVVSGATALAQTSVAPDLPAAIYRLTAASNFVEGCFDPCMCFVQWHEALLGTLRLTPAAPEPGFAVYDVRDVGWLVKGFEYLVTGGGTYRVGGQPLMHQLTLDLHVGDREVTHYDSGLTPVGPTGPGEIAISISMNNLVCTDTVFHVTMRPIGPQEGAVYGLRQSLYEEGCFGPCDCAVTARPFVGRFGLVRLDANAWAVTSTPADFAVVDLRGSVLDPGATVATPGSPVTGTGLFHVDPATRQQRLRLSLIENGAGPTRFDSGDVPWGGTQKQIDASVAESGFACYDRVYEIHARRLPRSDRSTQAIRTDPYHPGVVPVP